MARRWILLHNSWEYKLVESLRKKVEHLHVLKPSNSIFRSMLKEKSSTYKKKRFVTIKSLQEPKYTVTGEWINKLWYIYNEICNKSKSKYSYRQHYWWNHNIHLSEEASLILYRTWYPFSKAIFYQKLNNKFKIRKVIKLYIKKQGNVEHKYSGYFGMFWSEGTYS